MTTPEPVDPLRDDSPTTPVDLPPFPPVQPPADAAPADAAPADAAPPSVEAPSPISAPPPGAAPWDQPGPLPPLGAWGASPAVAAPQDPTPPPGPEPTAAQPSWDPGARPPAQPQAQPGLVAGIVLVVVGVVALLLRLVDVAPGSSAWPLWIMVPGLAMLAGSLAIPPRAGLGLAIPGTIIAIVGAILWVQETYDLYATWAYAWALVAPTGPGLAMLIYGLARGDHELAADGFRTTLVGIGLFIGFAFFFEGVVGISGHRIANLDQVFPYIAIGFGVLLVVASLFGGGRRGRGDRTDQPA